MFDFKGVQQISLDSIETIYIENRRIGWKLETKIIWME